jgi:aryl-phospho-beta-D-glucosidase BglC (GH1 family)
MASRQLLVAALFLLAIAAVQADIGPSGDRDCASTRLHRVRNRQDPMRGSNLGSWLIQEDWMVGWLWQNHGCDPNTYPGAYLLEQCLGSNAYNVISKHWASFITEDDFAQMAKLNLNAVRFPVGWWQIYDPQGGASKAKLNQYVTPTNYIVGGLEYIDKAFEWGEKYGIAILLGALHFPCLYYFLFLVICSRPFYDMGVDPDMHAAPGSQSGNQDSAPPDNTGNIYWDKYPANPAQTADSIELYAQRYANRSALLGFCLLNEPGHNGNINVDTIKSYYTVKSLSALDRTGALSYLFHFSLPPPLLIGQEAYRRVRKYSSGAWVVLNPLISPFQSGTESEWTGFMNPDQGYHNVFMSLHYYHCFGGMPSGDQAVINYARYQRAAQIAQYNRVNPKPMLCDEWSACGVSEGRLGDMIQAQLAAFEGAAGGWSFWAWPQTWGGDAWSLKTAFQKGWITPNQTGIPSC